MTSAFWPLADLRTMLQRLLPTATRPLVLYALYTLALFAICLLATFPYELAIHQALRDAVGRSMTAEVTGARLGWPLVAAIDDLRLTPRDSAGPPALAVRALTVAPSLLGLVRGTPFPIDAEARLYGGILTATFDPRPESFDIDVSVSALDLARYHGLKHFSGGTLRGRASLAFALRGDWTAPTTLEGQLATTIIGLSLEGLDIRGVTLPDLHFGQLQIGGTITNGRIDITEITGNGTELTLRGSGHILLRSPLPASLLNLSLTLMPTAAAPAGLRMAVRLIPGTSGPNEARIIQISGSLRAAQLR